MEKSLEFYLNAGYPVTVRPDTDDGGYIVEFAALHCGIGTGDTTRAAIANTMIAESEWIKAAHGNNIAIPESQSNDEYNMRLALRIPKSPHKNIIEAAKKEGVSTNQFLNHLISLGMGKRQL